MWTECHAGNGRAAATERRNRACLNMKTDVHVGRIARTRGGKGRFTNQRSRRPNGSVYTGCEAVSSGREWRGGDPRTSGDAIKEPGELRAQGVLIARVVDLLVGE